MKNFKPMKNKFIVSGTMEGHPFLARKNMARPGASVVPVPPQKSMARIIGRKLNASRPVVQASNAKGAV
jgi:hypothetical protein